MKMKLLLGIASLLFAASAFAQQSGEFQLSTHVLDTCKGIPAEGVTVTLYKLDEATRQWVFVDEDITSSTGRIGDFLPMSEDNMGAYKLRFETQGYFKRHAVNSIYPFVEVAFYITDATHYHIPITLSAYGYATYRGN